MHTDETETEFEVHEENWAYRETSSFRMKPVFIVSFIILAAGASAFGYFRYNDPAAAYDRAPIVNPASNPDRESPRKANAEVVTKSVEEPVAAKKEPPVAAPVAAAAQEEVKEPELTPEVQPEVAPEPLAEEAVDSYEDLLTQAKKTRRAKAKAELLRKAIEANPSGHEAMAHLALALMERRSTQDEALEMGLKSTELQQDNGMAWLAVGYIKQLRGKAGEAKQAYRKCADSTGPARYVRDCKLMR